MLFVHAHPDDETLATGVAIAHHAARGADVHVLTATLGEEGEVIPPALAHLEGAEGDPLAEHRRGELAGALAALGATGHLLTRPGGAGAPESERYRDSGMAGSAAACHSRALAAAPLEEVAEAIRRVVDTLRPHVVVTYDRTGGYGHPDHVRVHEATLAALAGLPDPPVTFVRVTPQAWAREDRSWLGAQAEQDPSAVEGWALPTGPLEPSVVPDAEVTHVVDDPAVLPALTRAMRCHATQVVVREATYALSNVVAARVSPREAYAVVDPATGRALARSAGPAHSPDPGLVGGSGSTGGSEVSGATGVTGVAAVSGLVPGGETVAGSPPHTAP